ncbi:Bax inhibitor-1/YccA family protein [Streptomyces sp. BE20]|uniref:Bax inhibitor-1/YccA family protein n=1 Tax=unclassified Streptomyces TaxID=2593676 RepID=UPI002E77E23B|nr:MULTISPECIES: Bax inhibitor-1/YccA family protein [unclassified Streptomyces]MED7948342.1 Bax inhibitor-1/YccA family protein [Streptomyces sp. BE303]MEE1823897.1 Bax inhibitor-1/YccA family protein [Streptomyces sp. BE20]
MRSSNPVFSREGSFTRESGYAGFGTTQTPSAGGPSATNPYGNNPYGNNPYAGSPYAQQPQGQAPLTDDQLVEMYRAPSAGPLATGRMTLDDVVARTAMTLLTLVAGGGLAWFLLPDRNYGLAIGAGLVAFVVGMVVSFKRSVSPPLILTYAALEGFALGAITKMLNAALPGIAIQAVLGTAAVFAAMLIAYKTGRIRVTPRYTRIGIAIAMGFVLLLMINMVASMFGADMGLRSGPLGIAVGLIGIALGAFFLSLDFAAIEEAIAQGAPQKESWRAAFGLTLSLVWIYIEMLRLIAILRGDD